MTPPLDNHSDQYDDQHDDDKPVGRLLNRREMLVVLGSAGLVVASGGFAQRGLAQAQATAAATAAGTAASTAVPSCVVRPELTEGPYFVDKQLNRTDIRTEPTTNAIKAGIPLKLIFRVSDVSQKSCAPYKGVQVDVWHCDALGVYSGVQDRTNSTVGQSWLRGYQVTDDKGVAEFMTIYPGWYSGRAVHIHFKLRTDPASNQGYEFTSQLFFTDALSAKVYAKAPYASKGNPDRLNARDNIFQQSQGQLTLEPIEEKDGSYTATFSIGLDTPKPSTSSQSGTTPAGTPSTRP